MGRLPKKGVDYFSHDVNASTKPTLFTIQQSFGNDGYAFWFKLLEFLGTQEGLYADFSNKKDWLYFLSIAKVDGEKGEAIMSLLAGIDAVDEELWETHRIVWSENFRERVAAVYTKRGISIPKKPIIEHSASTAPMPDGEKQQGEEQSIGDDGPTNKESAAQQNDEMVGAEANSGNGARTRFRKPTLEEVSAYCEERKNGVNPQQFIDFYESKGWKVGNQPMKDWKASVRTWEGRNKKPASTNAPRQAPSKYNREE